MTGVHLGHGRGDRKGIPEEREEPEYRALGMFRAIHLLLRGEHRQVEDEDVWTKTEMEEIERPQDEQRTKGENIPAINSRAHKLPCLFTKQIFVG